MVDDGISICMVDDGGISAWWMMVEYLYCL